MSQMKKDDFERIANSMIRLPLNLPAEYDSLSKVEACRRVFSKPHQALTRSEQWLVDWFFHISFDEKKLRILTVPDTRHYVLNEGVLTDLGEI